MMRIEVNIPPHISGMREKVNTGFSKGIQRVTAQMTTEAMAEAPRKTGNLKRSIHAEVASLGGFSGKVIQDIGVAKYGPWVHNGTGLYGPEGKEIIITPTKKKALFWKGAKHPVKRSVVKGMKPRPFMKNAFEKKKPEVPEIIKDSIMREVNS
jgi:HK97 gp10 family phage protein